MTTWRPAPKCDEKTKCEHKKNERKNEGTETMGKNVKHENEKVNSLTYSNSGVVGVLQALTLYC